MNKFDFCNEIINLTENVMGADYLDVDNQTKLCNIISSLQLNRNICIWLLIIFIITIGCWFNSLRLHKKTIERFKNLEDEFKYNKLA